MKLTTISTFLICLQGLCSVVECAISSNALKQDGFLRANQEALTKLQHAIHPNHKGVKANADAQVMDVATGWAYSNYYSGSTCSGDVVRQVSRATDQCFTTNNGTSIMYFCDDAEVLSFNTYSDSACEVFDAVGDVTACTEGDYYYNGDVTAIGVSCTTNSTPSTFMLGDNVWAKSYSDDSCGAQNTEVHLVTDGCYGSGDISVTYAPTNHGDIISATAWFLVTDCSGDPFATFQSEVGTCTLDDEGSIMYGYNGNGALSAHVVNLRLVAVLVTVASAMLMLN